MRVLASAAALALMTSAAFAADFPAFEPAPIAAPVPVGYSWTGFYVGLNAGYAWEETDVNFDFEDPAGVIVSDFACIGQDACVSGLDYDSDGFLIGAHAGFNWQAGWAVFGVEGDIAFTGIDGDGSVELENGPGTGFVPFEAEASTEYDFFGTLRARVGAGLDRVLVYGTGGLAFASVEDRASWGFDDFPSPDAEQVFSGSDDSLEFGWTLGGGVDVAVTDRVIVGVEALYFDLGENEVDLDTDAVLPDGTDIDAEFDHDGIVARARVSVKLGG